MKQLILLAATIALFLCACGGRKIMKSDEELPSPPQSYDECRDQSYELFARCEAADGPYCELSLQSQITNCKSAFERQDDDTYRKIEDENK